MATGHFRAVNQRTGAVAIATVEDASGPWRSFKGLMFRRSIPPNFGMRFRPVRGIHTHFMRFPIDLVFFDDKNTVVKIREAMVPWRFDFSNAAGVIEMNAGEAAQRDIRPGDTLLFEANGEG